MEAKVKEEIPDKDYSQQTNSDRRKSLPTKEHRSPEQEDPRVSPTPGPPSPQHNGTAESSSPPLSDSARSAPALLRLRRFLSALQQFANDVGADTGERVRQLVFSVVSGAISIEEFQSGVQEVTNYPLRASVPGFLRALLPAAQALIGARARHAKQTPLQYIRSHEQLVLEAGGDASDIFAAHEGPVKRRGSEFYDGQLPTNGACDEYPPPAKRPFPSSVFLHPPLLYPLPGLDYHHSYHCNQDGGPERRDGGITVRDVSSMNAPFAEPRTLGGFLKTDDEWKNINTMLNCILSMVEKTKRALAILQQRGTSMDCSENSDIKRTASEILASAVRQTEERVAEVRRRAEDAVNQVKRQALVELQRAVGAAEAKASELVAAERGKMERLLADRMQEPPPPRDLSPNAAQQNCCWNCGRKAQETCSGCGAARYCGAFCQHKDWEHHHQVCSGRDQKPSTVTTSPPTKPSTRSSTPHPPLPPAPLPTAPPERHTENRLSLSTLNTAERMLSNNQERGNERLALANLSTAQGLIAGVGGKK